MPENNEFLTIMMLFSENLEKASSLGIYHGKCPFCDEYAFAVNAPEEAFACLKCQRNGDLPIFFTHIIKDINQNAYSRLKSLLAEPLLYRQMAQSGPNLNRVLKKGEKPFMTLG